MARENFQTWMRRLNALVMGRLGVAYDDLPDLVLIRDVYDSGDSPEEALVHVLEVHAEDDPMIAAFWDSTRKEQSHASEF